MKLEQQVVSSDIAKKLKELGVKQDSLWYWTAFYKNPRIISKNEEALKNEADYNLCLYSAFTCAELGEMLPVGLEKEDDFYLISIWKSGITNDWRISYIRDDGMHFQMGIMQVDESFANILGKMKIYLIEKGLVKV